MDKKNYWIYLLLYLPELFKWRLILIASLGTIRQNIKYYLTKQHLGWWALTSLLGTFRSKYQNRRNARSICKNLPNKNSFKFFLWVRKKNIKIYSRKQLVRYFIPIRASVDQNVKSVISLLLAQINQMRLHFHRVIEYNLIKY